VTETRGRGDEPPARSLRLFVAVNVPDDVKAGVAEALEAFRDRIPGARWTRRDGWHVTLKFLGATWPRMVEPVKDAVRTAAGRAEPFETAVTVLGAFPSARRARVLWAGLTDPEGRFAGLVTALDDLLKEDFTPEERAFTPHLTVARLQTPRALDEFTPELPGLSVASRSFAVEELVLYQSHVSRQGATYTPLLEAPLGG
jgi:RNA 2',3'-cyclic 3'-phosphodiesterase